MAIEPAGSETSGLSRRQLLTRGAIAGGLVWAAPVIRTTAAYATTANGTEQPCANFFMVVIKPDGSVHDAPEDLNSRYVPPAIRQWFADNPDVPVNFPARDQWPFLTQTTQDVWAVLLADVTGPNASGRQCRMVLGWARKDRGFKEGYVDPNPPLAVEVGRRLLFPCPDPGNANANANGVGTADATISSSGDATADATISSSGDISADASGSISSDGSSSGGSVSSDGAPSPTVSSDGSPSVGGSTGGPQNPHNCIDAVFLIYCCPG